MKEVYYLIVGLPRSGNTVLHLALAAHPQVSACIDEIKYHPFFSEGISVFTRGGETEQEKQNSHLGLFQMMASLSGKKKVKAYGLHTVISHTEAADLVYAIQKNYPAVRIIYVKRLNIIAQLASVIRSDKKQLWISMQPVEPDYSPLSIDRQHLIEYTQQVIRALDRMEDLKTTHSVKEWIYEFQLEQCQNFTELFDFLGLDGFYAYPFLPSKLNPPARTYVHDYFELLEIVARIIEQEPIHLGLKKQFLDYIQTELSAPLDKSKPDFAAA
ncbi:MAG: hypothetical protein KatS3mg031_0853 [Chitinophagales bacterium]|nr:MAG: hypothetical protein KatS3mg031_0853 [Chitinophagales bacterium]